MVGAILLRGSVSLVNCVIFFTDIYSNYFDIVNHLCYDISLVINMPSSSLLLQLALRKCSAGPSLVRPMKHAYITPMRVDKYSSQRRPAPHVICARINTGTQ